MAFPARHTAAPERDLDRLAREIRRIEGLVPLDPLDPENPARVTAGLGGSEGERVPTGWESADRLLAGGLARGRTHEWAGCGEGEGCPRRARWDAPWSPPLCLLTHLAGRALTADPGGIAVWIGRRVWAYPQTLAGDFELRAGRVASEAREGGLATLELEWARRPAACEGDSILLTRSIFVEASDRARRSWAIDLALRNPAVAVVIADVSGFDMAASRRLQLAAAEGGSVLGLTTRPPREAAALSAASTRWRVERAATERPAPAWRVTLTRSKG